MTTPAKDPKKDAAKPTVEQSRPYVVLALDGVADATERVTRPVWTEVGRETATTDLNAIKAAVAKLPADEQGGTFIAVAERYWNPRTPKTETVQKTVWS